MMTCSEQLDKIAPAIVAAQAALGPIAKSATNKFDNYRYATLGDYVTAITPVLAAHGLAAITSVDDFEFFPRRTSKGNDENGAAVSVSLTILHTSGQYITVRGQGEGQDRADKAIFKGTTGARKYVLAAAFGLATTDDPEADESVGGAKRATTRTTRKTVSATDSIDAQPYSLPSGFGLYNPEKWNEYISQLPPEHLLPFFTAIVADSAVLSQPGFRHAICNAAALRTRSVLTKDSPDRAEIGRLMVQQKALLA